jgi:hypothetical protein
MRLIEQISSELGIGASDGRPIPFQKTRKVPSQTSKNKSAKNTEYAMYLIRETILRVFNLDGSLSWFYSACRRSIFFMGQRIGCKNVRVEGLQKGSLGGMRQFVRIPELDSTKLIKATKIEKLET